MPDIWIVDDEPSICWGLRKGLEMEGYAVRVFPAAEPFAEALQRESVLPGVVLLDVCLPGESGLKTLHRLRERHPTVAVILMTAFGDLNVAVNAVRGQAFEYLTKPFDLELALHTVRRALTQSTMVTHAANENLASQLQQDLLLGSSAAMQQVYKQIALAANGDASVLIDGEHGTGKSIVAAMIHRFSTRASAPFLAFCPVVDRPADCDSELFGCRAVDVSSGASYRSGLLELAGRGTLVVDEIGLVPHSTQAKLLAAIESQRFYPLQDNVARDLNARLLFTSIHDIDHLVAEGEVYEPLRSHLQVCRISLPPLRERRQDIRPLAQAFLALLAPHKDAHISENAMKELDRREWRGNVRELRHTMQRALLQAKGNLIQVEDLPNEAHDHGQRRSAGSTGEHLALATTAWLGEQLKKSEPDSVSSESTNSFLYDECIAVVEEALIREMLDRLNGNRAAVAIRLGIHRTTLRQKMKRYGLE